MFYDVISLAPNENSANVAQVLKSNLRNRPSLKDDKLLNEFQSASSQETLLEIKQKITLRTKVFIYKLRGEVQLCAK